MNKKDNKTKVKNKDNGRIIKRNWWKISIIVSIVIVILIGISVGLYFLLRPTFSLGSDNYITKKDPKEISQSIREDKNNEKAIFFYEEDNNLTNWLTWDNLDGQNGDGINKKDGGHGPLNNVVNKGDRDYYAINLSNIDDQREMLVDLFVNINDNDPEATELYSEFSTLQTGDELGVDNANPTYYLDWKLPTDETSNDGSPDPETGDWADTSLKFKATSQKNSDGDWEYDFVNIDNNTRPTVNPGTLIYFSKDALVENVFTVSAPPTQDQIDSNSVGNINDWFEYLNDFKFE